MNKIAMKYKTSLVKGGWNKVRERKLGITVP